jgi:hypothetical protein
VHGADEHTTWTRQVSSFLRTVRPVLGDRSRACRWGGSIVDSVVGTFLTQNVSDALSSSAFMTLAAHFRRHADRDATPPRQEEDIRQGESTGGDELMSNAEEGLTAAQATSVDDMRIMHPTQNCTPHNVALAGSEREACSELGQQRDAPAPLPDRGELPIGEDCCDWEAVMNAPPAEVSGHPLRREVFLSSYCPLPVGCGSSSIRQGSERVASSCEGPDGTRNIPSSSLSHTSWLRLS